MSLLSTHSTAALPLSPRLLPRAIAKLASFSLLHLSLTSKPPKPFPLLLRHPASLSVSPWPPLLPPPRASYDIPIRINDEEYERFLDRQPWRGAVVYKRNASVAHVEYCTSLDRLAVGWLSTRVSADRAAEMGLKLPPDLKWNLDDDGGDGGDGNDGVELDGHEVMIEGKDEDDNSVFLSVDELRNAKISVKYDDDFDDEFDDDDDEFDDEEEGEEFVDTPVLVSVDVTRRRGRIRLDGIIRTVITLDCNRLEL